VGGGGEGELQRVYLTAEDSNSPAAVVSRPAGHVGDSISVEWEEDDRSEHGALYVALTRVRQKSDIRLLLMGRQSQ
jgi:hypothetical protein